MMRLIPQTEPEKCPYRSAWNCDIDEDYPNEHCFGEYDECLLYKLHMLKLINELKENNKEQI